MVIANIGPRERKRRLLVAAGASIVAAALAAILAAVDAPRGWRLLLFLPFWIGALGLTQARLHTCVFLAYRGVCNMDTGETPVRNAADLAVMRQQAKRAFWAATLLAALLTAASLAF